MGKKYWEAPFWENTSFSKLREEAKNQGGETTHPPVTAKLAANYQSAHTNISDIMHTFEYGREYEIERAWKCGWETKLEFRGIDGMWPDGYFVYDKCKVEAKEYNGDFS